MDETELQSLIKFSKWDASWRCLCCDSDDLSEGTSPVLSWKPICRPCLDAKCHVPYEPCKKV
jgi:hypothetical protein